VKNIIPEGFAERLIADGTRTAAEALAQHIGTGIELVVQRKNGSEFPIEIMLSPLESAEGTLVTAATRDISVRKAAEKHLAQTARIHVVSDGLEAMAFLRYQGPHLGAPRPDLIMLDLNMPKMSGVEVLAQVKADPWLRTIPIIVLTTSEAEPDIVQSYQLMASCYLTKPPEWKDFESLVRSLNDFWLARVAFPKRGKSAERL